MKNLNFPKWLHAPGASPESIRRLQKAVPGLPDVYLQCLAFGNGGEVGLRVDPLNLCLDSAESALDYWLSGTYTKHEVFIFGTSGGGTYFAFELCACDYRSVVCFDPISPEDSTKFVAANFEELLLLCEE